MDEEDLGLARDLVLAHAGGDVLLQILHGAAGNVLRLGVARELLDIH